MGLACSVGSGMASAMSSVLGASSRVAANFSLEKAFSSRVPSLSRLRLSELLALSGFSSGASLGSGLVISENWRFLEVFWEAGMEHAYSVATASPERAAG